MHKKNVNMRQETKLNPREGKGTAHFTHVLERNEMLDTCTMFAKIALEPGTEIGEHAHATDAEIYYILEGTFEVNDNGTRAIVEPGDVVYTSNGEHHSITNICDDTAVLLAVIIKQ